MMLWLIHVAAFVGFQLVMGFIVTAFLDQVFGVTSGKRAVVCASVVIAITFWLA